MKKGWFVLFVSAFLILSGIRISAEEYAYRTADFGIGELSDCLPDELSELLPEGIWEDEGTELSEDFSIGYFGGVFSGLLQKALAPTLRLTAGLLGFLLLSSLIAALRRSLKQDEKGIFSFLTVLCLTLFLYQTVSALFTTVKSFLDELSLLVNSLLPILGAVSVAGGDLAAAGAGETSILVALTVIETVSSRWLLPILQLSFGLAIASGIGSDFELDALSRMVRNALSWIFGLLAAAISAIMTFQTAIAARSDSLSMRAVRFAVSGAIPAVGNLAGEAVATVAGSLSLVKSTVGWLGVILILLLTLPTLLSVLFTRLSVVIAIGAADLLGLPREKKFLEEMRGILGFLLTVCVISSLMFLYALTVFAKSVSAFAG